ncbi:hypothetical protein MKZ38_002596 [Zalerion maritima]|uniref:Major facilitator superfamily (MFS) profile domain-containing protein n=1 Tax=Zalerion maritima TaxID=339359 RepID=A0AAD5RVH5_9PEZI|nr:hypothetical protein MKZ38_002596 [Zalerion maritima]
MLRVFRKLNEQTSTVLEEIQYDPDNPEAAVRKVTDCPGRDGFQWKVWWVAGSGFFTTSYSIFSINVVAPALTYIYPDCDNNEQRSLTISLTTLSGSVLGMILFGFLADRYGRKSVYGLELAIVVVASIGLTTASEGHNKVMDIYGWIAWWRFLMGIGLGAEYPLSATIAAEWSSTRSRGRMMAAVFMMQSVGQLAAYAFGLAILAGLSNNMGLDHDEKDYEKASRVIDAYWRVVVGISAFPALVSLILRRLIPETPSWLAIRGDVKAAAEAAQSVYRPNIPIQVRSNRPEPTTPLSPTAIPSQLQNHGTASDSDEEDLPTADPSWLDNMAQYFSEMGAYLRKHRRWRFLAGVMIAWFLLDVAFYGLGLDNPRTISTIWLSKPTTKLPDSECWRTNPAEPDLSIYYELKENMIRNLLTISTGTMTGSFIILLSIDYIPRVTWMSWMFVALGGLFFINGGTFFVTYETDKHALTMAFYVLAQTIFNLGPNTITFMVPAELFATKYRATFHGLAAAAGKLGAIMIQLVMVFSVRNAGKNAFAGMLLGMGPTMLLGALVSWAWIPEVQYPRGYEQPSTEEPDTESQEEQEATFRQKLKLANKPLEIIANDPTEGQCVGFRNNAKRLLRHFRGKKGRPEKEEDDPEGQQQGRVLEQY